MAKRGVQERKGAHHIGLQESLGLDDGAIDMGLGGEMEHARETVLVEQAPHQRGVADVALDEVKAAVRYQGLEAADIGRVSQRVDDDHAVFGTRELH